MELKIRAHNVEITQTLENYLDRKLSKMSRYLPGITEAYVELSKERTKSAKDRFRMEVTLRSSKAFIRAEERSAGLRRNP